MSSWKTYDDAIEKGPWPFFLKILALMVCMGVCVGVLSYAAGWFQESGRVLQKELGPEALLRKYEWFKNTAATLQSRQASIQVYEGRLRRLEEAYKGQKRSEWPRSDREQANLWEQEVSGIISSFNSLAAEFNANMSKENWRFTNAGDLPAGSTQVMPREFQPYRTN